MRTREKNKNIQMESHMCETRRISFEQVTKEVFNYKLSKTYRISEKGNKSYIELKKNLC